MDSLQLLLVLGALWVWLGFKMSELRNRYFPLVADWVPLVLWFLLLIVPIGIVAWNAKAF